MTYDIIIANGHYFDGTMPADEHAGRGPIRHLGIANGKVAAVSADPLTPGESTRVIDAGGRWVCPGFIEAHSHYDAEIIVAPELAESVRHGVTTVMTGICSISMVCADPEDCSDLFTRVEAVPRDQVLPLLHKLKRWRSPAEFRNFFESHPLGPNLAPFIGHSDIRVRAMGLDRAVSGVEPTAEEMRAMETMLEEALDAGFAGLSTMTTKLDRMDGDRAWAKPLPSTYARWREYRRLHAILRHRGRVLQSAPDAVGKINIVAFFLSAIGWFRKALKMSLLTVLDLKSMPNLHVLGPLGGRFANTVLKANLRWQFLPSPFVIYAYGLDFNSFGELADARILRDVRNPEDMYAEAAKPEFRAILRRNMKSMLSAGLWHREFADAWVVECPDASLVGKNFAQIGRERNRDAVDTFLDLALEYRERLRWGVQFAGERVHVMRKLCKDPQVHIGFADSGAHLKNLASYNFPLCMLKYVRDAELEGKPFMSTGHAVHRLTGELADWYGIDAGHIRVGDRADVVVVNPEGLGPEVFDMCDVDFPAFHMTRLANRNDRAVDAVLINGRLAYDREHGYAADLGKATGYGRFLPARPDADDARSPQPASAAAT
ncbi:MAG: N-acyl-D-glutamate amidohydrolase [Nevskiales bacterium]|nr:N-acyl-D-glutamate amidohydrolase [Nevskiales bacterium]